MKINKNFFKKICGKISKVTISSTVGFKPENRFDFEETTYLLGIKINYVSFKNVNLPNSEFGESLRKLSTPREVPDRIVIKGFMKS